MPIVKQLDLVYGIIDILDNKEAVIDESFVVLERYSEEKMCWRWWLNLEQSRPPRHVQQNGSKTFGRIKVKLRNVISLL